MHNSSDFFKTSETIYILNGRKRDLMNISKIKKILFSYDIIKNALLFGSYADNTQHTMSDIDIAVETKNEIDIFTIGEMISKLENATDKKIDFIILNDLYKKSPLLAYNIYQKHKIIFLKDENSFKSFKENALHCYMDFKHILDEQNKAFSQRIADGDLAKIKTA